MADVIITVPGTGDTETGEAVNRRDADGNLVKKWWEPGSGFEQELLFFLGPEFEGTHFEPFIWSGANSELDRRKAAARLLRRLRKCEKAGSAYHLIGHSHGGSVIAETMDTRARRKPKLKGLRSVTTIGTPYLYFGIQRFSSKAIRYGMFNHSSGFDVLRFLGPYGLAIRILLIGPIRTLLVFLRGDIVHGLDAHGMERARENFGLRWQSFWHVEDEAIRALSAVQQEKRIRLPIFQRLRPSAVLRWLSSFSLLLGLLVLWLTPLYLVVLFAIAAADKLAPDKIQELMFLAYPSVILGLMTVAAILRGIQTLAYFGIDPLYRRSLGKWLDGAVSSTLRTDAYGLDVTGEDVREVLIRPLFVSGQWRPLPQPIHGEMLEFVNRQAVETVSKLRGLLGSAYLTHESADLLGMIGSHISWKELLHTTYFDNARFVKLVAYGMLKLSGQPISTALHEDSDFPETERCYLHVSGTRPVLDSQTS